MMVDLNDADLFEENLLDDLGFGFWFEFHCS